MTNHQSITRALKARLSELMGRVAKIDNELHKHLPADLEEQATDLEDLETLEALENSEVQEIRQIQGAVKRIAEGTYGVCAKCGEDIDPKRIEALPTATSRRTSATRIDPAQFTFPRIARSYAGWDIVWRFRAWIARLKRASVMSAAP